MSYRLDLRAYLTARHGKKVEQYGLNWAIPCPDCDPPKPTKPHLYVNIESGQAICYRCAEKGEGGKYRTLTDLVAKLEDIDYGKALQFIRENSDRVWEAAEETEEEGELRPVPLPLEYRPAWKEFLPTAFEAFFAKRGVDRATREQYRVGYAVEGKYKGRAIVPVVYKGGVWSFVARDVTGKAKQKVLDPKGAKKSRLLFNVDSAAKVGAAVITEGVWDAIRVGPAGVALLGHSLSDYQLALLIDARPKYVTVMLDGDMAEAATKLGAKLSDYFEIVRVVHLEGDPDDYPRKVLWRKILDTAPVGTGAMARAYRLTGSRTV